MALPAAALVAAVVFDVHANAMAAPLLGACQIAQATQDRAQGKSGAKSAVALSANVAPALGLKFDPVLDLEPPVGAQTPLYIFGKSITGQTEDWVESVGDAEFRRLGLFIKAHRIRHDLVRDELTAQDQIRLFRSGEYYEGTSLKLKLGTSQGRFDNVSYQLTTSGGRGTASHVDFIQPMESRLANAVYTTCPRNRPAWELRMREMMVDQVREVGSGKSVVLYWGDTPLLPVGDMNFPISEQRKTGVLPPTYGTSTKLGLDVQVPFYWNIAPQHDMTLYPRLISKRGEQLGTEFRFLRENAVGTVKYEILPNDRVSNQTRQLGAVTASIRPIPQVTVGLNVQRASDDNYFSDLGNSLLSSSQRLLPGQLTVASSLRGWNVSAEVQRYQLLQDIGSPLIRPYSIEPKVAVSRAHRASPGMDAWPIDWSLNAEAASFRHPTLEGGDRFVTVGSAAWRQFQQGFQLTPKITLHATQYMQQSNGSDAATLSKFLTSPTGTIYQNNVGSGDKSYTRVLPTFSMDVSTVLEREFALGGAKLEQTLEPRLLYVRTPYKDQSAYPVFDTGAPSLNYAQMFSDTAFTGHDRVADLDQLTAGVTTRLNDQQSGAERFRAGVAQRFYFSDQRVTLPGGVARTDRKSDFLGQVGARPAKDVTVDGQLQYTPSASRWQSAALIGRYTPKPASAVSLAYRFVRGLSNTVDVAFQWPVAQHWYAVGRYQHALKDLGSTVGTPTPAQNTNLVEAVAGFEYDGGCWVGRVVLQQYAVNAAQKNTAFFFQIELNGMGGVGTSPLSVLSRNIPNYRLLNQVTPLPPKFDNFQ